MSEEVIVVAKREEVGKSATRRLRKSNLIPAVIYGLGEPEVSVAIDPKVVARIIASETGINSLLFMRREGTDITRHTIIKSIQRDPVTSRLAHVDFMRVDPNRKVRVKVPVVLTGNAIGVKEGGILDFTQREVELECLPNFIPASIDLDITHLRIGDAIRLEEVKFDSRLTVLTPPQNVLCAVHGRTEEEEPAAAAEGEASAGEAAKK